MADLAQLFSNMGAGAAPAEEPQANPLAALMQNAGPQADPALQAPSSISNPPQDPQQAAIDQLQKQIQQNIVKLQQPIQSEIPPELLDFNKYNEQKYEQTYGGGGKFGVAGRVLANLLSGATGGGTIRDELTKQNQKEWSEAVKAQAQRISLEKAQLGQATQQQAQQLQSLRLEQQIRQQAAAQATQQQRADQSDPNFKAAAGRDDIKQKVQDAKDSGLWDRMTKEEQKTFEATGKLSTTTPSAKFLPGSAKGSDILLFHPDAKSGDKPLDPKLSYRLVDRGGVTSYEPTTPPGYMVPQTTTAERATQIGDTVQAVPYKTTRGPSDTAQNTAPTSGGRTLGPAPWETKRGQEPTYTASGQKTLSEVQPVKNMLESAQAMLEPLKDSNGLLEFSVNRGEYAIGLASQYSKLINKLELEKIIGAARVLKGSSRAIAALEQAAIHLPDPKKDSAKLMYEKIQTVLENLDDIEKAVDQYERKYPGRTDVKPNDANKKKETVEERRKRLNY